MVPLFFIPLERPGHFENKVQHPIFGIVIQSHSNEQYGPTTRIEFA